MAEEKENTNSVASTIVTIVKLICVIILLLLVIVLAFQRFTNNEVAIGGIRVFRVETESMIPVYEVGDVLVVKEVDLDTLELGDDVTYQGKVGSFAGKTVTHRLIGIDTDEQTGVKTYHTQGVNNDAEDPTISGDQIYGKVIYKCVIITLLSNLMNNSVAFFIVIIIPMAILVVLQMKDSAEERSYKKRHKNDKQNDDEE